jgi:TPR repeat protein
MVEEFDGRCFIMMMSRIIKTTAYVRLLRSALTALLMLAAIAGTDLSGSTQFEKGRAAYGSGDYGTALRLWRPLAAEGDAMAQFYMGVLYENGWGITRNYAEAAKWYRLAAEQNNAAAQANLADMYNFGRGVPKNEAEAIKWYCRAADSGEPIARDYFATIFKGYEELCVK